LSALVAIKITFYTSTKIYLTINDQSIKLYPMCQHDATQWLRSTRSI